MAAVVFVPSPPILLPEVSATPDPEVAILRESCRVAVATLLAAGTVRVLGGLGVGGRPPGPAQESVIRHWPDDAPPGIDGYLGRPEAPDALPLSLTIGRTLLQQADYRGGTELLSVLGTGADIRSACAARPLVADAALLVVGDGCATRTEKSPGHLVAGSVELDDRIAELLDTGDINGLTTLPDDIDSAFLVDGRAAWQCAAAMVANKNIVSSRLTEYMSPHGVAYFVAVWELEGDE